MKKIDTYIIEKLHLNDKIEVTAKKLDMYPIGTKCIFLSFIPGNNARCVPSFIAIDVVEITKITDVSIICKYLTHICCDKYDKQVNFKYTYSDSEDHYFITTQFYPSKKKGCLVPLEYCEKVIKDIKDDGKISYFNVINNKLDGVVTDKTMVVEKYHYTSTSSLIYKNVKGITIESIDKLTSALGL